MSLDISFYYKFDFIIFDFDGVILESNEIKNKSFKKLFASFSKKQIDDFINYHKKFGGISRYEKIKYFFKKNKIFNNKKIIDEYLNNFSNIVKKKVLKAKYVPGVKKFISNLSKNNIPIIVISGSDQNELKEICKKRKINKFLKIYGSPSDKFKNYTNAIRYLKKINRLGNNGLIIGDSKIDYEVSKKFKIFFLYISQFSEWNTHLNFKEIYNSYNLYNFKELKYEK